MNKITLLLLLPFFIGSLSAQEIETHLLYNPYQAAENADRLEIQGLLKSTVATVDLPFIDDFSRDHFPGNGEGNVVLWEQLNVYRNLGFGVNPPSVGVATFDGLDALGKPYALTTGETEGHCDTLTSMPMNLDGTNNVVLSFFYQPEGLGEKPEFGDSLILQFYIPSANIWLNRWHANGSPTLPFQHVVLPVQDVYLQNDFQFRFVSYGNQEGSLDVWHIDWVRLDENRLASETDLNDTGVGDPVQTLLNGDLYSMPWTHFTADPEAYMTATRNYVLKNNGTVGAFIAQSGYTIFYDGTIDFEYDDLALNDVAAGSSLPIPMEINTSPNNYTYTSSVNPDSATFEVSFEFATSPDLYPENNGFSFEQTLSDYYCYDDGQAERGYGFSPSTGLGQLALRFDVMQADSLSSIDMYLLPGPDNVENALVYLTVWQDNQGEPGDIIYEDLSAREIFCSGSNQFVRYCLDSLIYVEEGPIFLGLRQVGTVGDLVNINIGNDKNHNSNADRLRYQTEDTDGWQIPNITGSLLLRAGFSSSCELNIDVTDLPKVEKLTAKVWPNPARDYLDIQLEESGHVSIELYDAQGRIVQSEQTNGFNHRLQLNGLANGLYYLHLTDLDSRSNGVQKIVIGD